MLSASCYSETSVKTVNESVWRCFCGKKRRIRSRDRSIFCAEFCRAYLTDWLPELFAKNVFFVDILAIFSLELDRISSDLLKNSFAAWRHKRFTTFLLGHCCWFSTLLREVFLRVLRLSPLLKNQYFQVPIRSWNARTFLNEILWLLGAPWLNKLHLHFFLHAQKSKFRESDLRV